jgi:hypothetical protein
MQSMSAKGTAEATDQPCAWTRRHGNQLAVCKAISRWLDRELSFARERNSRRMAHASITGGSSPTEVSTRPPSRL